MRGFLYRLGVGLKDLGERIRLVFVRDVGLAIREFAMNL